VTLVNKYQEVEDLIVAAIRRGQKTDHVNNGVIWNAMSEVTERDDNPYVANAIKTRMQKLRDQKIIQHCRTNGWSLVPKPEQEQS